MKINLANKKHRGAALIEVVIAGFLFAVGFLSLSNLQIQSFRSSNTAEYRAHASMLALDVIERMKASKPSLDDFELGEKRVDVEKLMDMLIRKQKGNRYDDIMLKNLRRWHDQVYKLLPNGRGCVTFRERKQVVVVEIMWRDSNETVEVGYNCDTTKPDQVENYFKLMGKL
jgi:type IV pilus modification protein PilV